LAARRAGHVAALDPAVQSQVAAALSGDAQRSGPSGPTTQSLFVSPTTIKSHINHLFAKAGLRDRTQAVNYAYRSGIATPPR
jgi:hypothetical protein